MKTRAKAIQHAKRNVTPLSKFGDGWRFSTFDLKFNAWRESIPTDYYNAQWQRRVALIESAREFLDSEYFSHPSDPGDFVGGKWTDYIK